MRRARPVGSDRQVGAGGVPGLSWAGECSRVILGGLRPLALVVEFKEERQRTFEGFCARLAEELQPYRDKIWRVGWGFAALLLRSDGDLCRFGEAVIGLVGLLHDGVVVGAGQQVIHAQRGAGGNRRRDRRARG
jgi:hypothetical protein